MTTATMKKPFATRLDENILKALSEAAENKGVTIAKYLEQLLVSNLKIAGTLPDDFKPEKTNWGGKREKKNVDTQPLPEGRGGKRSGSGKKRSNPSAEKTED